MEGKDTPSPDERSAHLLTDSTVGEESRLPILLPEA
jgi:hypothetical protein